MPRAIFLDINTRVKGNESFVELMLKLEDGKVKRFLYEFKPYFYVECDLKEKSTLEKIAVKDKAGTLVKPRKIESVEMELDGERKKLLKITCYLPSDVPLLRSSVPFRCYESKILYIKRFLLDFELTPFSEIEFESKGELITEIKKIRHPKEIKLNKMAFDIETYNPLGTPRENKDPMIMISYAGEKYSKVLTYKKIPNKEFVRTLENEQETIEKFCEIVSKEDPDVIYGYNSTNFDIPYLDKRAEVLKTKFEIGRWDTDLRKLKKGLTSGMALNGRIHLDLYPMMRFMGILGILKSKRYTLDAVYHELIGGGKKDLERKDIWKMWDSNELDKLAEYSLTDAEITYELGNNVIDLFIELSKVTGLTLFEASLSTSGQMVEFLLMRESVKRKMIIPPRPKDSQISERLANPIEGAFVKIPSPGIYENIAVMDFRGLYPSIIISYNIDPFVLTDTEENANVSPMGWKFKKSPMGLVPSVLKELVDARKKMKDELKKVEKNSNEYKVLSARSNAYKIISNSFYGYLGYARSRWYNRKCAESVTAWGREHIKNTIQKAEECGFKVLYGDTDSVFLLMEDKNKKDVLKFVDEINTKLPEDMELEMEGFFSSGVFVGKKTGEGKGAKKKYALLAEDGSIKIRGFELVRRDWSPIAKYAQKRVLEIILKDKDKEKAAKIVKDTIDRLKSGTVPLEELVIYTRITKDPNKYDIMSPEVSAAKKMIAKGLSVQEGSMIAYVVGKKGKTISEKAEPFEFATDYDADYYIQRQVLPSVMKILKELGFSEDDLKFKGKQIGLDGFF